jgi:hypothetical protein
MVMIDQNAFYESSIRTLDFSRHTSVAEFVRPSTTNILPSSAIVIVPDALYDEWIVAETWSEIASQIVKVSEFYN